MSDQQWPSMVRSAWRIGILIGYGLALAVFFSRLFGGELPIGTEFAGAVTLGLLASVSPTLAMLAGQRRPGLLLPAAAVAILSAPVLSIFGYPMAIIGLVWLWVHHKVAGSTPSKAAAALLAAVVLWFGAAVVLFIHIDPACSQALADGTVQEVDPGERAHDTGWAWDVDTNTFSGSGTSSAEVQSETCSSDVIVLWEAIASSALSIAAVMASWYLVKPVEVTQAEPAGSPA